MLFNRQGVQQKNWRMVKKGKQILFGCSLFFVVGGMSISSSQVTYASDANSSEVIAKQEKNNNLGEQNSTVVIPALEKQAQSSNKKLEKTTVSEDNKKFTEKKEVKEVNKKELKDLVDKIKETDISKKTEKSVKELNLILSRVEKTLDNKEITQEEIDKEIRELKEAFDKLEDKPKEDKKSEVKEKDESKKDNKVSSEKDNKEKQEQNSTEDVARKHNEKITKVTETVNEIHSIANQINYEFSESEKELVKTAEKLPTAYNSDKYNEEAIQKLLKEVIYLRNKVANRMTRAHSGKRDPRNGQPINGNGESRFRAVYFLPTQNQHGRGEAGLVTEARTDLTYYNSDEIYSFMRVLGQRGPGEPLYKYEYGENRGKEDGTPYYLKTVGVISGLDKLKGITLRVAYKNPRTGKEDFQDITSGAWPVNNPEVKAVIRGWLGRYDKTGEAVEPGDYRVTIAAGRQRPENSITYTFHIKAQSERNTVNDLATPTYVDDVRHLTETEKTALIKKFEAAHPGVVNRPVHVDYDHAEVSADGATMTIHFKDGFAPKTIQTNAQNDAVAKYQNLTALYGDPHDFYKNPRNLVKSITGNELPSTVDVQWKTPFNLQQPGTRNAVVTVTYQNGTVKDVSTPYTVLDFVGKQDKRINQYQSGELGDARSYITLSNGTAPATDLTIRWKGGSTVDTSRPTIHRKQIEILRGNTVMKTVDIPVEIVDNIRPTVEIPYDNPGNQEVYLYSHENNNITLKAKDNNGKISKVYLAFPADNRQGLGQEDTSYLGGGRSDGLYLTATKIKSETTGSNTQPATITVSGNINNQPFTGEKSITRYLYTEDPAGNANYEHVGHANDKGAAGRIRFVWKPQTFKYTATANSQTQTVSYKEEPSAEASVNKTGLPSGTTYAWKTKPDTSSPGSKTGVVEVTYPDTSKDTVNVTVAVRKLSDEYAPTGNKIVRNQNAPVINNDLKAAVTISNNGNSKVKSVTPVGTISTTNAGTSTIKATVTYLDDTTDPVDIPLEVKDVTAPTIQSPSDRQNWDLIALDRTLPSITVTSVDNNGGTGVKSTTVTGLPDFLVYDNATKTIKFKNGVQEVTKLPVGQDSKTYTATIQVTDNANNPSQRQFTITVKSMTTKYNATPNAQKQTVSYGEAPDAGTSVNKTNLPAGTTYTWATTPSTTTGPGDKAGVVTVTYPDGSKDTVNVTVNVRALNDEYKLVATEIEVNQNDKVSNDRLKTVVSATSKVGGVNGIDKISTVTAPTINTANYGSQNITATVTFKDGTVKEVTIPIKVKDVTKPTISAPGENTNWEMTALDKTLPPMEVRAEDNANGSGIKSISVTGLPDYLEYDKTTNAIKFKAGKQGVEKLPTGTQSKEFSLTIRVEDNAGNISERKAKITVYSMSEKNNPTPLQQTVDNGHVPNAEESVNKTGLPEGTTVTWKTTPDVSTPGSHPGVALVHYPDGTEDEVEVPVTVKKQSDTFNPTAKEPNQTVRHKEVPDPEKSINTNDLPAGTKYSWSEQPDTSKPGSKTGKVLITYPDKSTEEVTVTVNVTPQKDEYNPTAIAQEVDNGHVPNAEESVNKTGLPEGTTVTWKTTPDVSTPGSHPGVALVHYPDGTEDEVEVPVTVKKQSDTFNPTAKEPNQTVRHKEVPDPEKSINTNDLPAGTKYSWSEQPDTSKPGSKTGKVLITYPDKSTEEVTVTVNVTPQKDEYNPTAIAQEVDNGHVPNAEESVNKTGLPEGTTVTWKTTPDVSTPGSHPGVALVHYPDGTEDEVEVPVTVKKQSDTFNPTAKEPNQTVRHKEVPDPEKSINTNDLPAGTKYSWSEQPDTSKPGSKTGKVLITYPDKSTEEVTVTVNVTPQKDEYNPTAIAQEVDNGHVPNAEESVNKTGLPEGTTVTWKTTPDVSTPGSHPGVALVHYPDGTEDEVEVPVTVKKQSDTFNPTAKEPNQTVRHKEVPDPEKSINTNDLPAGTKYSWSEQPDTSKPGSKTGKVLITYPDKSTEEVTVTVNVTPQKDEYNPTAIAQEVDNGHVPNAEESVNKTGLPEGTTVTWKTTPDVSTPGSHPGVALVHYPDGTEDEVEVPVTVKKQSDTFNPTAKEPNQTVRHKEVPDPEKSINTNDLPAGTKYSWSEQPDTSKPGSKTGKVLITYPDKSTEEVTVTVNVTPQKDEYNPTAIAQEVDNGHVPNAEESVNKTGLPEGTTVTWKTTPDVSTPGSHPGVALVHYPDGTEDEVEVPVTVKKQSDTFNPTAKEPNQTVRHKEVPDPEKSINTNDLPAGTKYSWSEQPDTSKPGSKTGKVLITYPDKSTEEVTVTVNVTPQKDEYNPTAIAQEVDNGHVPNAEESVNKTGLPEGTTVTWKTTPDVSTPGSHPGVALVHYPDGTEDEVEVPVTVKKQSDTFNPTAKEPNQTVRHKEVPDPEKSINTNDLPAGTKYSWSEQPDTSKPGSKTGKVLITYPDKSTEEVTVTVNVTPQKDEYNPTAIAQEVDNGHVPNAEESVNKTGLPEGTTVTWKTTPDVSTPGSHPGVALVHYPDGTEDEVEVPVTVKKQSDTFNPTAKEPNQTVRHKEVPDPEKSINTNDLPAGTKYSWSEQPDTSKPGSKTGKVLITYPDKSTEEVTVTVNVTPQKDEYNPTAIAQEVDNGHVPNAEESVNKTGLPEGTTVTWKTTPDVSTPGSHPGVALVHYPDGTEDEVEVPVTVKKQSDTFNPTAKEPNQTVRHKEVPDPEKSINTNDLPAGTKYSWSEQPDTSKPGSKTGKVLITYPDKSTEEVTVTVNVTPQKDEYNPTAIAQEVDNGHVPNAEESVNKTGLPEGTTVTWKTTPDVSTPGSHPGVALVHYPDGTEDEVEVPVTVKKQSDTFNPTAKEPNQTVRHKEVPDPEKSINTNDLPAGTKYSWSEQPDTSKPGSKTGKVLITYPDKSTEEVTVTVNVTPQKDEYNPTAIAQEVDNGHVPNAEESVNKTGLPEGTTVTWKTTPDVSTPGSHPGVALVHYPDGTEDEVEVPVTVKKQSDTFNPTAKEPNQTVRHKEVPDPEKSINTNDLPAGTKYSWSEQPDTSKPGSKTGKVLITYPDKSTEEVTVTVNVTPQKDEYNPTAIAQEVDNGHVPNAEESVNKTGLPEGTTVTWKTTPDVSTPGSHPGVALVHYPDGTEDEVEVPVTVKKQSDTFNPTAKEPNQTVRHKEVPDPEKSINTNDLPAGTKYSWSEQPDTSKPGSKTGKVLITYPDKSTEEVTVTVNVTPQKDEYNPTAIAQEVDNGHVPNAEESVNKTGLPEGTTVTWKTTPDVSTPGSHPGVALVHYPDGTEDEVEVPVTVKKQSDTFNPTAKEPNQTVRHKEVPDPEKSINTNDLPAGTKYSWSEQPDTSKPGSKTGKVLITYPDKSTEEVTVTVNVTPQKDEYNPTAIAQEVDNGHVPNAEESVNKTGLPEGTTVTWKTTPDVSTPGSHPGVALVHYPDGTEDEVEVPVTVKKQSDTFNPTAKEPNQTVRHKEVPDPEKSINTNDLPAGTKYSWSEQPDTSKPGSKTGKVLITYPDKSTEEVTVTVNVTPQKDEYNPTAIAQEVDNGHVPNAEESVNKTGLPEGTTVTWKTTPDVSTPGSHPGVALVHYPDGTEDEVEVPVTVKKQSDTFNPTAKEPNQTVRHKEVPDPEKSINTNDLPAGTKYSWSEQPDTSKPGSKTGKVLITYPDKSTEEVTVTVNVTPQKDEYNPTAIAQEVDNGHVPNAEESVNKTGLPEGTTVTWKTTPDVSTPGSHPGVALVHYPDGTEDEVPVTIVVRQSSEKGVPETNDETPEFSGGVNPSDSPSLDIPEYTDPIGTSGTDGKGNTIEPPKVDIPEYTGPIGTSGTDGNGNTIEPPSVDVPEYTGPMGSSITDGNGNVIEPPIVNLAEFSGGVNGELGEQPDLPEFNGGANGMPEEQPDLPEFNGGVNGEPEVQPTQPEFNGGVNGMPEEQPELPNYNGRVAEEPNTRLNITSKVTTKRLANTGETQNNSELAGLGLAILGLFAAIKRRKNEEE